MAVIRMMKVYEELPCGCVIGRLLCPEAERLWAEVGAAYRAAMRGARTWEAYMDARAVHAAHYWKQGVYAEDDLRSDLGPRFREWLKEHGHTVSHSQEVDHGHGNGNSHERQN